MKRILIIPALFCVISLNAQPYQITFAGSGASSTVATVKVENLTAKTSLTVNGNDILRLTGTTNITSPDDRQMSGMKIFPNPMEKSSVIVINPHVSGEALITVFDINGKQVSQVKSYLEKGTQEFVVSGLVKGFYLINIKGRDYSYSGKLVSAFMGNGTVELEKRVGIVYKAEDTKPVSESKGNQTTVDMAYTAGDRLMITGTSGIYSTVVTDIPSSDKTITFEFVACTDGDNINYPVVKIGTQTWMAKNLMTTKYSTGTSLTLASSTAAWNALAVTDKAYCYYNDVSANAQVYGILYNWAGAMDGATSSTAIPSGVQGACPTGWHLPSNAEWLALETTLGGAGAGGKLKETGTTHWQTPNTGALNSTGFTAPGSGWRTVPDGLSDGLLLFANFWSTTEVSAGYAYFRYLYSEDANLTESGTGHKKRGQTVRCVKN